MKNNFVKAGEEQALTINDGDNTYLCYPDYSVPLGAAGKSMKKWAVKRIKKISDNEFEWSWAGGNTDKVHAVNNLSSLTFKYFV